MNNIVRLRRPAREATEEEWAHWLRISKDIEQVWPESSLYLVMIGSDGLLHLMGASKGEDWPAELRNAAAWVARFDREDDAEAEASCPCEHPGSCDDCTHQPPRGA
jgi:hypothetical protein